MTRFVLLLCALFTGKAVVVADEYRPYIHVAGATQASEQPDLGTNGRNFNNAREVPDAIPSHRCLQAVYGPELRKERNYRIEWWYPPISQNTLMWLYVQRDDKKLKLLFCDHEGA